MAAETPAETPEPAVVRGFSLMTVLMNNIGTVVIVIGMAIVCGDVFARNLFNAPFFGVPELMKMTIVAIVFLQLPYAILGGRMIRSDVFLDFVGERSPTSARIINAFHMLGGALFLAAVVWGVWPQFVESIVYQSFVGLWVGFRAPVWPIRTIVVIGALLGCLAYLLCALLGERKR